MRTRHRFPVLVAAALLLTACSGSGDKKADPDELSPRLASAKKTIDAAETVKISLATKKLPSGVTGLLSAKGSGNHSPAFKGKITVITGGTSLGADVVAVGGQVYAKTSFAPVFLGVDPASLEAPDPASLLDTDTGVTQILVKTQSLTEKGRSRSGSDVLTAIGGTLPGSLVRTIIPSADAGSSFAVTYRLDDDDVLRDATLVGPFYPDSGNVTYTVTIATSDTPVTIKKP